jgi:hypothetical protein
MRISTKFLSAVVRTRVLRHNQPVKSVKIGEWKGRMVLGQVREKYSVFSPAGSSYGMNN